MDPRRKSASIPMGEIGVSLNNGPLRTLLGSCIGVALWDRKLKMGGLAHVVMPTSGGRTDLPGKFADTAVPEVLRRMQSLVPGEILKVTAKIAGGANMFQSSGSILATIGDQNQLAIERVLNELRIPLLARHCGGEQGRRMMLDPATGLVTIDVVGAETITL